MLRNLSIVVKFDIEGYHKWPTAPEVYKELRSKHGHIFHFECFIPVKGANRDLEFLAVRRELREAIVVSYGKEPTDFRGMSCEHLADSIVCTVKNKYGILPTRVVVMEDLFVGAELIIEGDSIE